VRDLVVAPLLDHEHAYRRALGVLRRGVDLVHLLGSAARDEGDRELADWSEAWVAAREKLIAAAADELDWFARHPNEARLPASPALSST
jgi:hypothetical protein